MMFCAGDGGAEGGEEGLTQLQLLGFNIVEV
jgi:hypothetical protein